MGSCVCLVVAAVFLAGAFLGVPGLAWTSAWLARATGAAPPARAWTR